MPIELQLYVDSRFHCHIILELLKKRAASGAVCTQSPHSNCNTNTAYIMKKEDSSLPSFQHAQDPVIIGEVMIYRTMYNTAYTTS